MRTHRKHTARAILLFIALSLIICIPGSCSKKNENIIIEELSQLDSRPIGYLMGASFLGKIEDTFPNSRLLGFESFAELISALKSGRIDAYFVDKPIGLQQMKETPGIKIIGEPLVNERYGIIFNKEKAELHSEFNSALQRLVDDGTVDFLIEKWIKGDGDASLTLVENLPAPKGTLKVAVESESVPFAYIKNDSITGYEVELLYMICGELGYKPELTHYEFSALLQAVIGGRADMGIGCITYTDERAETMLFSDSIYNGGPVAMIRSKDTESADIYTNISQLGTIDSGRAPLAVVLTEKAENTGFLEGLKESFNKNLVVENRWKMILSGLLVTIELSVLSILFGTLLGFVFSFMLRSKYRPLSAISNIISVILDGLPLLIILMVFYYIIFARTNISAALIGVLGLSLDFANCVAGTLNTGIKAVDKGQIEAAKAMGYSKFMVFKKITFPQAANQMFGSYSGSVISLVKETSIIGYIAVEDLTKVSDIIMSRTFEAFFPLVFTAIIYFIIARIFVMLLDVFAKKLEPKHRERKVKGVKYRDQY